MYHIQYVDLTIHIHIGFNVLLRTLQFGYTQDVAIDLFTCSDSSRGKEVAIQLAKDAGFAECYDFGGADKVELLEQFALAWITLAIMQGMGRNIGFQLLRR